MKQIRVFNNYGGAPTNFQRIHPGVYDTDDEALFGAVGYLVRNGHAEWVDEGYTVTIDTSASEPVDLPDDTLTHVWETEPASEPDYPAWSDDDTNDELWAAVIARGIKDVEGTGRDGVVLKKDLIAVLRDFDGLNG